MAGKRFVREVKAEVREEKSEQVAAAILDNRRFSNTIPRRDTTLSQEFTQSSGTTSDARPSPTAKRDARVFAEGGGNAPGTNAPMRGRV